MKSRPSSRTSTNSCAITASIPRLCHTSTSSSSTRPNVQRSGGKGRRSSRGEGVGRSEAAELFDVMDRLDGWAVIIALVGGGQEIFLGEAGLEEWGRAVAVRPDWRVVASPEVVSGGASVSGHRLFTDGVPSGIEFRPEPLAHLSVGV